jgi:hypothetical protein
LDILSAIVGAQHFSCRGGWIAWEIVMGLL